MQERDLERTGFPASVLGQVHRRRLCSGEPGHGTALQSGKVWEANAKVQAGLAGQMDHHPGESRGAGRGLIHPLKSLSIFHRHEEFLP